MGVRELAMLVNVTSATRSGAMSVPRCFESAMRTGVSTRTRTSFRMRGEKIDVIDDRGVEQA